MNRKFVVYHLSALLTVASFQFQTSGSQAFEVNTHGAMSVRSVNPAVPGASSLDGYLRQVLNFEFPDGVQQPVNGKQVRDWIEFGSREEDSPDQRVQEHFHDPTKPWNQAGPSTRGISSVIWSQLQNQDNGVGGGNHSWKDARDSYFNALTSTNTTQRQQHWADTFQSVGNLIHLVQDAASPAHTRNDLHLSWWGIGDTDRLHVWGETLLGLGEVNNSGSLRYDPSILELPPNNFAPIPIARIIDTEKLKAGIPSEGLDIGIAEYSNANFFSDDTIFDSNYQTPTDLGFIAEPGPNEKLTQYLYRHPGSAGTRYKLAVLGSVADSTTVPFEQRQWELDDFVMKDYGTKLFPRAIGYSAGLIDYFFRGQIFADSADSTPCFWPQSPGIPPTGTMWVWNNSPDGEETGFGQLEFIFHYEVGGVKHFIPLVSTSVFVTRDQRTQFTYSTAPLNAVPTNATNLFTIITYRGPLGQETDAVIGGRGQLAPDC